DGLSITPMRVIKLGGNFMAINICLSAFLSTESYAFSKSTKRVHPLVRPLICLLTFLMHSPIYRCFMKPFWWGVIFSVIWLMILKEIARWITRRIELVIAIGRRSLGSPA